MQLSDFFHPLNITTLITFVLILAGFDAIGFFIAGLLKLPTLLRYAYWVIGAGFFVFLWFLLHFFVPFAPQYVATSLIILSISVLPFYFKKKAPLSLIKTILIFPWPIFFFILVCKPLFFKDSMPPMMWDEMAYHYYSPARLVTELHWEHSSSISTTSMALDFFSLMPRFMDTAYVLFFSLTKTYATARLFHTFIFFTSAALMGRFLQKKLSTLSGVIFAFLSLFFNLTLLIGSTTGYTDTGTASLLMMYLVCLFGFVIEQKKSYLRAMMLFAGMSLGSKYTSMVFICSSLVTLVGLESIFYHSQIWQQLKNRSRYIKNICEVCLLGLLGIIYGGYFYLRNFLVTGNPIYPFVFPCWKGIVCGTGGTYFAAWTMSLSPKNFFAILNILFQNQSSLYILVLVSLLFVVISHIILKRKAITYISLLLTFAILLEVTISHKISGFELRYFSHWLTFIPLLYVLPLGYLNLESLKKNTLPKKIVLGMIACLAVYILAITLPVSINNIKSYNAPKDIGDNDRWFALGKMSFLDWLHPTAPHMYPLLLWCGEAREKPIDIYTADPKLIYWTEGLNKIYLVNCNLHFVKDIWALPATEIVAATDKYMSENHGQIYVAALSCQETQTAMKQDAFVMSDPFMKKFILIHQEIICHSQEVGLRRYIIL